MVCNTLPAPHLDARPCGARRISMLTDQALFDACGVRVAFTGRAGGVSEGVFASLNLGAHVQDNLDHVMENRARVMEARARQEKRFADESISYNSQMTRRQIEEYCRLSGEDAVFLEKVERQQGICARGHGKILKVARTLADLDGQAEIGRTQLAEAIGFRSFEKKYWGSL